MFGLESQIFSIALILFLGVAAAKLTIEQLISLVVLIKKLSRELKGRRLPINVDREIMSGTPVFKGTRVPVDALMNNLAAGVSLGEFLQNFPSVRRDQALAVLNFSGETLRGLTESGAGSLPSGNPDESLGFAQHTKPTTK